MSFGEEHGSEGEKYTQTHIHTRTHAIIVFGKAIRKSNSSKFYSD